MKKKDSSKNLEENKIHPVSQILEAEKSESNENGESPSVLNSNNSDISLSEKIDKKLDANNCLNCEICYCSFENTSEQANNPSFVEIICGHKFCKICWEQ